MFRYTPEMMSFIQKTQYGISRAELAEKFNERFGTDKTAGHMHAFCNRHHWLNGIDTRIKPGTPSPRKGKKLPPEIAVKSAATQFKKGHVPSNHKPVGTETLRNLDGRQYYFVKIAEPHTWEFKHRLLWERENGPIPKDSMVCFSNGDTTDCRIENLHLETKAQHAVKAKFGLQGYDKESQEVMNKVADLKSAAFKKRRRKRVNE